MTEIFKNQSEIALRWRAQIDTVERDKAAAKRANEPTSGYTRRINAMQAQLSKLLSKGVRE